MAYSKELRAEIATKVREMSGKYFSTTDMNHLLARFRHYHPTEFNQKGEKKVKKWINDEKSHCQNPVKRDAKNRKGNEEVAAKRKADDVFKEAM